MVRHTMNIGKCVTVFLNPGQMHVLGRRFTNISVHGEEGQAYALIFLLEFANKWELTNHRPAIGQNCEILWGVIDSWTIYATSQTAVIIGGKQPIWSESVKIRVWVSLFSLSVGEAEYILMLGGPPCRICNWSFRVWFLLSNLSLLKQGYWL